MKKTLLIINLGTPDSPSYWSVFKYLREFLSDEKVLDINPILRFLLVNLIICPFRSYSSSKTYKEIWHPEHGSPLLHNTKELTKVLSNKLPNIDVKFAMRYQSPSISSVLDEILLNNPDELIVLPLFPHYAAATTGSVYKEVSRCLSNKWVVPKVTFINQFYDNPLFIDAWVDKAKGFDLNYYDKVIFSYHGVPNSHVDKVYTDSLCSDNDCEHGITKKNKFCYKATVYETTKLIAKKLDLDESKYEVTFQSRLTKNWLEPFSDKVLEELPLKNHKKVLVFSPAFTADCLETIFEIGDEYQELFIEAGGETLDYVPSLNYSDMWAESLIDIANLK
jgi:ferrochelatase